MKKSKYIVILLCMVFALCIFGACNADSKGTAIGEITGVTEIYLKTG